MIVYADNRVAHKMAEHGIQFELICIGRYLLDGAVTLEQLKRAGLTIKVKK